MDEDQPGSTADPAPSNAASNNAASNNATAGVIGIGLVVGLLIAGAVTVLSRGDDSSAPPPTVAAPTTTASNLDNQNGDNQNGDAVDLVVAYGRSRTDDHALSGTLTAADGASVPVRRAIMGSRAVDEVGATAAVTENGETRQCELIDEQWLCSPPLPEITAERDVQGFATLLLTEEPTYSVFAVSSEPPEPLGAITRLGAVTCWSMVSDGRVDRARFGAETTMCFHDGLGALVGRVTETSTGNNVFITDDIRADVAIADVEPSR